MNNEQIFNLDLNIEDYKNKISENQDPKENETIEKLKKIKWHIN